MAFEFSPPQAAAKPGERFTVTVQVRRAVDLLAAPFRVNYDTARLRLVDIARGEFLGDGQPVSFVRDVNTGVVRVSRLTGASGATGDGALVTLTFEALAPGESTVSLEQLAPVDSRAQPIAFNAAPLKVIVE
jgi:hypothetical protein